MTILRSFFLLLIFLLVPVVSSHAEDDPVSKIQKAYEGIKDIRGDFVQKSFIKDLKRTDTYNGRFFIKPPRMKWEYLGDKPQAIYITPSRITIYQKKENQVIKSKFDRATYGQAPISLLVGFAKIREEFDIVSNAPERVVIKPKSAMGNVAQIEIIPSETGFPIRSLTVVDKLNNRIEIGLNDVKTNTGIKNSVFSFTPPKGAAVLEQ